MAFPLSGNLQFYSEKHTIAAGATVRIRLQFQPDTIKFVSMVSITGRVDIKLGGMKGQGLIPLFLQGPVDLPGLEPEQRIELTNQDTIPHTVLVVAQKGYQPAGINAPAVSADVAHELLSSQHADTVVATPPIEGDLVVGIEQGDGSILWERVARGAAGDVLTVQANGSLAWGAPVVPASGALTLIESKLLTVAASTFNFTSIPSTYSHLRLLCYLRGDAVATTTIGLLRLNGDTGANYDSLITRFYASNQYDVAQQLAATAINAAVVAAASAPANVFDGLRLDILGYKGTAGQGVLQIQSSRKYSVSSGQITTYTGSAWWRNTAAINRLELYPNNSDNWEAGSRADLYGYS